MGTQFSNIFQRYQRKQSFSTFCYIKTPYNSFIMKASVLSAIILFVASVNGAPRGVDPSGNGSASVELASNRGLFDPLRRSFDVVTASKRGLFDPLRRSLDYGPFKRMDATRMIGASNEVGNRLMFVFVPHSEAPATPNVNDNMAQPDHPTEKQFEEEKGKKPADKLPETIVPLVERYLLY